jgi:hypothetical protein
LVRVGSRATHKKKLAGKAGFASYALSWWAAPRMIRSSAALPIEGNRPRKDDRRRPSARLIVVGRYARSRIAGGATMKTRNHVAVFVFLSAIIVAIALPALAYDYPLSSEAVREAYMLGKSDSAKRAEFFAKYTQQYPLPKTGSYVEMIQLETPFAVVVENTAQKLNYHAPDAAQEYEGKPAVFRVHVEIDLTESYSAQVPATSGGLGLGREDFWRDFKIRLLQNKEIHARTVHGTPLYTGGDSRILSGAVVDLEYDASKIKSDDATVEVITPDGQDVKAPFNLGTLR